MKPQPDIELARRLLAGDEAAFRDVFDGYSPKLYRFALARLDGDHNDAIEAVQQTFCNAFEHLEGYRGEASLYGWMCQICRNVVTDVLRQRGRQRNHVTLIEDNVAIQGIFEALAAPPAERPDGQLARDDLVRLIQVTLDQLPGRYGDVLEWKYVDGLSVKEIAARLAIAPKAAESLLTRARVSFREAISAISGEADLLAELGTERQAS